MKTTLILAAITTLSLGTLALVRAQDDQPETTSGTTPAPAETSEAPTSVPGIRTDVATELKLLGGTEEVTAIPVASVFAEGERFLVLARGTETATDFRETEVTLGRTDGLNVEVKTGLLPGDEVITVSAIQLRFPAFDDGSGAVCGVNSCGPVDCDMTTGVCAIDGKAGKVCNVDGTCEEGEACAVTCKDGENCEAGASCEEGETCTVACTDCDNCKTGVACVDCPTCSTEVDLTISADEFFNGSFDVVFEPTHFMGQPAFCPPY